MSRQPYGQSSVPCSLPHGRLHQRTNLVCQLQTHLVQSQPLHSSHPLRGQPPHLWGLTPHGLFTNVSQVLSPFSASPPKVLLSGFRSRCHIVVKGAFPEFRVRKELDQLIHLYTLAGFPKEELHNISTQILTQHQNLQTNEQKFAEFFVDYSPFPSCFMKVLCFLHCWLGH